MLFLLGTKEAPADFVLAGRGELSVDLVLLVPLVEVVRVVGEQDCLDVSIHQPHQQQWQENEVADED